jgi:hypothetical protein
MLPSKPSAKDFENPLLVAFNKATNGDTEIGFPISDLYQGICDVLGIQDIHAYGEMSGHQPKVARWIQWAARSLRDKGRLKTEGSNWHITVSGIVSAETLEIRSHGQQPTLQVEVGVPAEPPVILTKAPLPAVLPAPYHADPHIRRLAIQATPCFGDYAAVPTCHSCPLAVMCHTETPDPVAPAPETPAPAPAPEPAADKQGVWHRPFLCNVEMICSACGTPIPVNSRAAWLGNGRALHIECLHIQE